MCRWGCPTTDTSFMCKWCGTRYCRECKRGEFEGEMPEENKCRKCNQPRCQGQRIDYVPNKNKNADNKTGRGRSARSARGRSASPSKRARSATKSAKKGRTKSAKKRK